MEKKLKKVFSDVFGITESEIKNTSSPDNINEWDSFNHSNLIVALEQEFKITFTPDEMIELLEFEQIKNILEKKLLDK